MQKLLKRFDEGPRGREKAHKELEDVLKKGKHKMAECREDRGSHIYTVWSEPALSPDWQDDRRSG